MIRWALSDLYPSIDTGRSCFLVLLLGRILSLLVVLPLPGLPQDAGSRDAIRYPSSSKVKPLALAVGIKDLNMEFNGPELFGEMPPLITKNNLKKISLKAKP